MNSHTLHLAPSFAGSKARCPSVKGQYIKSRHYSSNIAADYVACSRTRDMECGSKILLSKIRSFQYLGQADNQRRISSGGMEFADLVWSCLPTRRDDHSVMFKRCVSEPNLHTMENLHTCGELKAPYRFGRVGWKEGSPRAPLCRSRSV